MRSFEEFGFAGRWIWPVVPMAFDFVEDSPIILKLPVDRGVADVRHLVGEWSFSITFAPTTLEGISPPPLASQVGLDAPPRLLDRFEGDRPFITRLGDAVDQLAAVVNGSLRPSRLTTRIARARSPRKS